MCGIAGLIGWSGTENQIKSIKDNIQTSLRHRGPDSKGHWSSNINKIHFFHTRLSILDLSSSGHQPMQSSCGRYTICFNGEIYNHLKLKKNLKKNHKNINWKSNSDTETLLTLIEYIGIENTLPKLIGMFAFVLFDRKNDLLYLVRDRMGEKPLYYGWSGNAFLFGSELKSLKLHPNWEGRINQAAVYEYMRLGYVPAPFSIYEGINKLEMKTAPRISLLNLAQKV